VLHHEFISNNWNALISFLPVCNARIECLLFCFSGSISFSSLTSFSLHFLGRSFLKRISPSLVTPTSETMSLVSRPRTQLPLFFFFFFCGWRAFYIYPIRFLDSTTNSTASFSCCFSFSIIPSSLCPSGDGIAFLITSNAESFSSSRGYMGLPDQALYTQDPFFTVEFDTSYDPLGDINGNHVGIDVSTIIFVTSAKLFLSGIHLKSGRQIMGCA
jgi:hypothetical protein